VYNPERNSPFGLLEIKCPIVQNINEVKCLKKDADGQMKLKRNDNYFYQIVTQMAVTGL
jgi:phage FluMu protein Com